MWRTPNLNDFLPRWIRVLLVLQSVFVFSCKSEDHPLHEIQQQNIVYSYIGNFIITREAIFLISIIALVKAWRVLVHVVFHHHRVIKKLRDNLPDVDYFLDQWGGVFDHAMKLYKYDGDDEETTGGTDDNDFNYYYDHEELPSLDR